MTCGTGSARSPARPWLATANTTGSHRRATAKRSHRASAAPNCTATRAATGSCSKTRQPSRRSSHSSKHLRKAEPATIVTPVRVLGGELGHHAVEHAPVDVVGVLLTTQVLPDRDWRGGHLGCGDRPCVARTRPFVPGCLQATTAESELSRSARNCDGRPATQWAGERSP